jgi:diacylglycerol kinase family enzyme
VYVATRSKRRAVVALMMRAAAGALRQTTPNFEAMALSEVRLDTRRNHIPVSIDGEVFDMKTPLRYRIRSRPLRVLVPADADLPPGETTAAAASPPVPAQAAP